MSDLKLLANCDNEWGNCLDTFRSVTGMCLMFDSSLVNWYSIKQKVVSQSTAEAEFRAIAESTCEFILDSSSFV